MAGQNLKELPRSGDGVRAPPEVRGIQRATRVCSVEYEACSTLDRAVILPVTISYITLAFVFQTSILVY